MNQKVAVMLESFGARCRLSLSPGQSGIAANMFANLLWILGASGGEETFIASREKLAAAIKAFRASNVMQGRRGKGLWKQSPFSFSLVAQRNDIRDITGSGNYDVGNTDCQNATDSEFAGYKSRLEPVES